MKRTIEFMSVAFAILGICAQGYSATIINRLPFTINSGGEYLISQDFSIASGTGIYIDSDDVTLIGSGDGKTIKYSVTGAGTAIQISQGRHNIVIKNLTLHQENIYNSSKGIDGSSLTSFTADNLTINIKSGISKAAYGFDVSGDSHSHIQNCAINISGESRFYGIDRPNNMKIHDCVLTVRNHINPAQYPYVIYNPHNTEIYNNRFDINGAKVNVFGSWGGDNNIIHGNVINYSSTNGGRIILINGGADGWEIYDNTITINSSTSDAQYVLRIRGIDGKTADNNLFHHNTVDITRASGKVYAVSLGDNSPMYGNKIYSNLLISNSSVIHFYHTNAADTDVFCNDIQAKGNAFPIDISHRTPSGVNIYNNKLSSERSDGKLLFVTSSAMGVQFCDNDINSSDISGGGIVSIDSAACRPSQCSGSIGAEFISAPKNLHISHK